MLRSYWTIFLRNFQKNTALSMINLLGLALGISCFAFVLLFAALEFSFDEFHHKPEQVFRIAKDFVNNDGTTIPDATTPPALAPALRAEAPEVAYVTRFMPGGGRRNLLEYGDKRFYEMNLLRVDSNFFQVFDFQFDKGRKDRPFSGIHSILLTETTARKYFGEEEPVGKVIRTNISNNMDFVVAGVLKDVPQNSHFTFDVLIPFESQGNPDVDWRRHTFYTYTRLRDGSDPVAFESNVRDIVRKHVPESIDKYFVQSLMDIHLTSRLKGELGQNGDLQYVRILLIIGTFVLLMAGVNYVNLVTAQSVKRAKEIGVRKVTGALRNSLISQFMFESIAMVFVASLVAYILTSMLLPFTKSIFGVDLSAIVYIDKSIRVILPASVLLIGICSGVYPALYLSSFQPLRILRGKLSNTTHGIRLRQGLVIFQFVMSSVLITGFLFIHQQLEFIRNKDLGFSQRNVLTVANVIGIGNPEAIAEDFRKIVGVESVARASGGILGLGNAINGVSDKSENSHISLNFIRADYDFIPTLGIHIEQGRNFSMDFPSDSAAIIINESAVSQLGLKEPVVGQLLKWDDEAGMTHDVHLVGVANDFHFTSFHEAINPFGFILEHNNGSTFFVKIDANNIAGTLAAIEHVWNRHSPDKPFDYAFQDEYTAKLHATEVRFQKLFSSFTFLAIAIACLGLVGLVTAMAESKTKEIGIRKALGSSVTGILHLLTKEFLRLVVIAFILAAPVAFLIVRAWLGKFAYRVPIQWQVFVLAGSVTVLLALAAVCFHSMKAALANPISALRSE